MITTKKTDLKIVVERPKRLGLATINNIFNKDTMVSNAKVFTGTVRSGQRIEFEGSIILLGDVNAGSEVVAEQNIIVLGDIRGHVHAGAKGNRSAFIAANSINPTQLRISDLILKNDSKIDVGNGYELARVSMGTINIEKWKSYWQKYIDVLLYMHEVNNWGRNIEEILRSFLIKIAKIRYIAEYTKEGVI